jgi:3-oxoadipate enol-lactonase
LNNRNLSAISWKTIPVPGAELAWTAEGDGPVAIWAHGLSSSSFGMDQAGLFDWSPVAAAGRRLVRYDARGHGRSTGRPVPSDWEFRNLGRDLLIVADVVSPEVPVSAIGSSLGTVSLLYAAVDHPERFDRLVLTSPPTAWEERAPLAALYQRGADLIEARGPSAFADLVAQVASPEIFRDLPAYPPEQEIAGALMPAVLRGVAASDLPERDAIAALPMPVLILAWDTDTTHPLSTAERLRQLIPGSRLEVARSYADMKTWGTVAAEFLR